MPKKIVFLILILGFGFQYRNVALAYDYETTHPALTEEIVYFYNGGGNAITPEEEEWIIQGSIEEDTPPRWVNHFYDPINNVGWTGENMGGSSPEFVQTFSAIFLTPTEPVSAVQWVNDEIVQSKYDRYGGDETWKRGLKYYADGDKKDAYIALGHALHLLEDMAVPEHTRNDTHVDVLGSAYGSPYEEYAMKWTRSTIKDLRIGENLRAENAAVPAKSSIEDYLIAVASYSNRYFFSKDTITGTNYTLPKIVRDDGNFGYGIDEMGNEFPLVKVYIQTRDDNSVIEDYSIKKVEADYPIFDAYFSHLSRQAVLNGAGAIALFEKQAQDTVVNKEFTAEPIVSAQEIVRWFGFPDISLYGEFVKAVDASKSFAAAIVAVVSGFFQKTALVITNTLGITVVPQETASDSIVGFPVATTTTVLRPSSSTTPPAAPEPATPSPSIEQLIAELNDLKRVLAILSDEVNRRAAISGSTAAPPPFAFDGGGGGGGTGPAQQTQGLDTGPVLGEAISLAEEQSTPTASSTTTTAPPSTSTLLFSQPVATVLSYGSFYSDNWYKLGSGFSGTLHTLTMRGMVDDVLYRASNLTLKEFRDPEYTTLVRSITISDSAPFTYELATTTLENLSITLKPYFYYRLDTRQLVQNRSVILAGDNTTGTAMWNGWGSAGREEHVYQFSPFMIGLGETATSTAQPPLTLPTNLSFNFDCSNIVLVFSWSSSTDPDWPGNKLHYEVNYSTSTPLSDDGWRSAGYDYLSNANLSYRMDVHPGNVYTVGVRARDDFGDISGITIATWSFPSDFVPPIAQMDHGQFFGYAGSGAQKITPPVSVSVGAVAMWVGPVDISPYYLQSQSFIKVYRDSSGAPGDLIATSAPSAISRLSDPQEGIYYFNPPFILDAGSSYWLVVNQGPSATSPTAVFGSVDDVYPDGYWSATPSVDAYFRLILAMPAVSDLRQYRSDAASLIPENGTTTENTVVFGALLSGQPPNGLQLQVEVKPTNISFANTPTSVSGFVSNGSFATASVSGLAPGDYRWRARTADTQGSFSDWQEFGSPGRTDFVVGSLTLPLEQLDYSQFIGRAGSGAQKITLGTALTISGVKMWLDTHPGNSCRGVSFLAVYADDNGAPGTLIATSSPISIYNCYWTPRDTEYEYVFPSPLTLHPGSYWLMPTNAGDNDTLIFGSSSDVYDGGYWSGSPGVDAHFRLVPAPILVNISSGTLQQFRSDAATPISEGETIADSAVVFAATLQSSAADPLRLEVQVSTSTDVTSVDTWFANPTALASSLVLPGSVATTTVQGLEDDNYHWRARAVDDEGNISDWQEFGVPGNVDFAVQAAFAPAEASSTPPSETSTAE